MFVRRVITLVFAVIVLVTPVLSGCGNDQPAVLQENGLPSPGKIKPVDYQDTFVQKKSEHLLIDVRTPGEFAAGYIPGAINIPLDQISQRLSEIPKDEPVVLYCQSGNRSNQATKLLKGEGYTEIYDLGGISQWQSAGMPVNR